MLTRKHLEVRGHVFYETERPFRKLKTLKKSDMENIGAFLKVLNSLHSIDGPHVL